MNIVFLKGTWRKLLAKTQWVIHNPPPRLGRGCYRQYIFFNVSMSYKLNNMYNTVYNVNVSLWLVPCLLYNVCRIQFHKLPSYRCRIQARAGAWGHVFSSLQRCNVDPHWHAPKFYYPCPDLHFYLPPPKKRKEKPYTRASRHILVYLKRGGTEQNIFFGPTPWHALVPPLHAPIFTPLYSQEGGDGAK